MTRWIARLCSDDDMSVGQCCLFRLRTELWLESSRLSSSVRSARKFPLIRPPGDVLASAPGAVMFGGSQRGAGDGWLRQTHPERAAEDDITVYSVQSGAVESMYCIDPIDWHR